MAKEITLKIPNCFDNDTVLTEVNVKTPDGLPLCTFTVRQLTVYEIGRCQAAKPEEVEKTYANLIKAGLVALYTPNGNGELKSIDLTDENLGKLSKSRLANGEVVSGLFETIAQAVLEINSVTEAEAKNSA